MNLTAGQRFRDALKTSRPLQIVGTINAYSALLAERAGFKAIYLSGAGVANASYGLPDLAMTNLTDVLTDVYRITAATELPLLVDIDTGWGTQLNIARTTKSMIAAGAAGFHIEDQVFAKRCGHRPGKAIVSLDEMLARVKAAADARTDQSFVIMARTDVYANEGLQATIDRSNAFIEAGADMIFPEAIPSLEEYAKLSAAINAPILANITEFGKTPLLTLEQLKSANVACALYPLSGFRAMSKACETVYNAIATEGTQQNVLNIMQTREELYDVLDYYRFEETK